MNTEWALYCDETGNTGSNFSDPQQPVFVYGGWFVRHAEKPNLIEEITRYEQIRGFFNNQNEIKGNKLLKSKKGRKYLADLTELMGSYAIPYFFLVEKRYAICAKIVESFYDPMYNPVVENSELLDPDCRQSWAQKFYDGPDQLVSAFAEAFRSQNINGIIKNCVDWTEYFKTKSDQESVLRLSGLENTIAGNIGSEFASLDSCPSGFDSLNMPIFVSVFQDMENHFPAPANLVHDSMDTFRDCLEFVFNLFKNGNQSRTVFKDGRAITVGLEKVVSLDFASSEEHPIIRASDCLIAACKEFSLRAYRGDSIDQYLSKAAFATVGGWACEIMSHMHPSLGFFPKIGTYMSSLQYAKASFELISKKIESQ